MRAIRPACLLRCYCRRVSYLMTGLVLGLGLLDARGDADRKATRSEIVAGVADPYVGASETVACRSAFELAAKILKRDVRDNALRLITLDQNIAERFVGRLEIVFHLLSRHALCRSVVAEAILRRCF